MFKEEKKQLTVKGINWSEEERAKFSKVDLDVMAETGNAITPSDVAIGHDREGNVFYQLIDVDNKTYINVPSMDKEFFDNLTDKDFDNLCNGKHPVTVIEHVAKTSKRKYYELVIE